MVPEDEKRKRKVNKVNNFKIIPPEFTSHVERESKEREREKKKKGVKREKVRVT